MSYTALYRKLRPQVFNDVIGQDHIIRTLMNQLTSQRMSHAYLFCGTRGTGKTSTAKIFARAVNCLNLQDGEPCNECSQCEAILASRSVNVIEIDAASNNGVDDIREIREEVRYVPAEGKYKVYIIDEVHMLSIGAFNALLKTLEEPPAHVVFILATTDPQKIPVTILSRCQRFLFKRISLNDMMQTIKKYISAENLVVSEEALRYICGISDGAMRDALSLLDQSMAFYFNEEITLEKVLKLVGSVDNDVFFRLTKSIFSQDSKACLEIIEEISNDGRDISQFVSEIIKHFRDLFVVTSVDSSVIDLSIDNIEKLKEQNKGIEPITIINYINIFSELQNQLKYASNDRMLLEIACIKLCNPVDINKDTTVFDRLRNLESQIKNGIIPTPPVSPPTQEKQTDKKIKPKAKREDLEKVKQSFKSFASGFEEFTDKPFLAPALLLSSVGYLDNDVLFIVCNDPVTAKHFKKNERLITEELSKKFGMQFVVDFIDKEEYNNKHKMIFGEEDKELVFPEDKLKSINMDITIV